jgi:hypothetical protein
MDKMDLIDSYRALHIIAADEIFFSASTELSLNRSHKASLNKYKKMK